MAELPDLAFLLHSPFPLGRGFPSRSRVFGWLTLRSITALWLTLSERVPPRVSVGTVSTKNRILLVQRVQTLSYAHSA